MTTQVNTDPNLSEVEFLRSVLRQLAHIARCTHDDSEFGLTETVAIAKIEDVLTTAGMRNATDDSIVTQLRREIGELKSRLVDEGVSAKELGIARSSLREFTREIASLRSQIAEQDRVIDDLRTRTAPGDGYAGMKLSRDEGYWLLWLRTQLAHYHQYGGTLDLKFDHVLAHLKHLAKVLGVEP